MDMLSRFNNSGIHLQPDRIEFEVGGVTPPYPFQHSGTCIVLGTHPCWQDDIHEFMDKRPHDDGFHICGVNEAGKLMPLHHLATCHSEKADHFMSMLGHQIPPKLHVRKLCRPIAVQHPSFMWDLKLSAGSANFAAMVMASIGYDLVVMAGCPMDGGGGYAFKETHRSTPEDPRIGGMKADHACIQTWHRAMKKMKEELPIVGKIRSMSGATKRIFGGIE